MLKLTSFSMLTIIWLFTGCGSTDMNTTSPQEAQVQKDLKTSQIGAKVDRQIIEVGKSIDFSLSDTKNIKSVEWRDKDGKLLSTDTKFNRMFLKEGKYETVVIVTDKNDNVMTDKVVIHVTKSLTPPTEQKENIPPVVKAKAEVAEVEDHGYIHLRDDGSYDPDGKVVRYEWRDMDGILLSRSKRLDRKMHYWPQYDRKHNGTTKYIKTLIVFDDKGAMSRKSFEVFVHKKHTPNRIPTVDAGDDRIITEGESVTLEAVANDPDGKIVSYQWKEGSVTVGTDAVLTLTELSEGVHFFTITVRDNKKATATDTVKVEVKAPVVVTNEPPLADAGEDQSVTVNTPVTLTGKGSDSDGTVVAYSWTEGDSVLSSDATFTYTPVTVGAHTLTLTVTDDDGATASDTVTVNATQVADTTPPVITLNGDATVTVKVGESYVDAGATAIDNEDGDISDKIVTSGSVDTTTAGTYVLGYDVQDSAGNSAEEVTRTVIVEDVPNQAPTADAGEDKTTTVGTPVTLNGSGSDSDGTVVSYQWTEGENILADEATLNYTPATTGEHMLTLTVMDDDGDTATDTVIVTATEAVVSAYECPATKATEENFTDSYIDNAVEDRKWSIGWSDPISVDQIAAEFNAARDRDDTISGHLVMPSQAEWDAMSDSEKALYLINSERCARGIRPYEAIDTGVESSPAQTYAEYLRDNNVFGHEEDGRDPWQRLEEDAGVIVGTNADIFVYGENLAYQASGNSAAYPTVYEPVAVSVYNWIYADKDDTGGNYGHRKFAFATGLVENFGKENKEGLVGVGVATAQYEKDGYYWTKVYTVLNGFDPNENWTNGSNLVEVEIKPAE